MSAPDRPDFDAFISYSHADKAAALRIQRFLESFPLPVRPGAQRRRLRVFRDDTDIRAAALTTELRAALARSRALIVCCSPSAVGSTWVQQEVDLFTEEDRARPVLPILVAGSPASALPAGIAADGVRYVDARSAWRLGFLRTRARDELVRVVATLAGEDLRTFIPWDRRRRRARLAGWTAVIVLAAVAGLFVPFEHQRALERPPTIGTGGGNIEFCDVVGNRLLLAARETYLKGTIEEPVDVQYVRVYPDAIGNPDKRAWLDSVGYLPTQRLLHASASHRVREFAAGIDIASLRSFAREHADPLFARGGKPAQDDEVLEPGYWAATPAPNLRIALVAVKPTAFDPAAVDGPPQGAAAVAVKDGDAPLHISLVSGLSPPTVPTHPLPPRGAALSDGLPLAVTPREVFIGTPMRKDGGAGGLWRWDRSRHYWAPENFRGKAGVTHANVVSLVTDPQHSGRVLLSTGPGSWKWSARKGEYAAEVFVRPGYDVPWHAVTALPVESKSAVQLCGFGSDARLYMRVDQSLFSTGPDNLFRSLLRRD